MPTSTGVSMRPGGATNAEPGAAAPTQRVRLPVLLLSLLPLLMGAALVSVALSPTAPRTGSSDATLATALAAAVARGEEAMLTGAAQAPIVRLLAGPSPAAGTLDRARVVLDELAGRLGGSASAIVLIDAAGRARLSRDADRGSDAVPLPVSPRDLDRLLTLREGALVTNTGEAGRTMVFAVPVDAADGTPVGALLSAVPIAVLFADAPGSAGGAAPVDPLPFSRDALLALAVLSLLAFPVGWWVIRSPRTRGSAVPDTVVPTAATTRPRAVSAGPPPSTVAAGSDPAAPSAAPEPGRRWGRGRATPSAGPPVALVEPTPEPAAAPEDRLDPLSGLGNHRAYQEELDRLLAGYERNKVGFSLLLLDLDDLKLINTRSGHASGDELLRATGRRIRVMLRFSDRAFRIGGDEFALLLPHTDAAGAAQLGQRLLTRTLVAEDGEPAIAFSGGAAEYPATARDRDQLMAHAAAALAWCKQHGRGSVQAFDPSRHAAESDIQKLAQEAAVAQVIAERALRAVFQPIVDMTSGEVVGYEGLTRPAEGAPFSNPGALFEAAEAAGRTVELDAACFETVAAGARAIPADRVVSINLSPRTMEAADFRVERVLATLAANELDPGRVILELTERETVLDLDRLRDNLARLQQAGVRIAADDVGAGNAGLRLLSQFRFDIVKVDLSLVQEGANNDASRAVLRSLRDLAQRWGAFVIAEGIETATQLRAVRELGLGAGQGYLIGRPGTIVDLPPVDLAGLEAGQLMLQNAPMPVPGSLPHGSPA